MLCQYLQETNQWQGHLVVFLLLLQASLFHSFVQSEECGVPGRLASRSFIGGGAVANRQDWPWFAHLQITHSNYTELCGGSLLTDRHVLTAAHCTHRPRTEIRAQKITVTLGKLYAESYETFDGCGLFPSLCLFGCTMIIYVGIGMKSGVAAMNHFRHSCEKFLLLIYHALH